MYDYCHRLWEETGGALDIAAGPVFDVWGFGFSSDSLPDADRIADALARSGMGRLVPRMEDALDAWDAVRDELTELEKYYTSREWKADFDADAAGKLPADLKRGVLSEDGIDSVLERFRDLEERIG